MAIVILFSAILLLAHSVYASAPPPSNCDNVIIEMIGCVEFVRDGSNETKPNSECCEGLKTVVGVSPTCLCEALEAAADMGYEINRTRAAALTKICNVDVPGFNGCGGAPPSSSPSPPPSGSSPAPPVSPPPSPSPSPPPSGSSPAPPVSPPLPTPEPPVSPPPPSPAPTPAVPVSPPLPSQPSPAPEIPPVGSPIEAEAPSSASWRASSPLELIAGVAAAGFALFVAV